MILAVVLQGMSAVKMNCPPSRFQDAYTVPFSVSKLRLAHVKLLSG